MTDLHHATIEGRPAMVAYFDPAWNLVKQHQASLVKVVFMDGRGGTLFLTPINKVKDDFNPEQERVPAGQPGGGEFAAGGKHVEKVKLKKVSKRAFTGSPVDMQNKPNKLETGAIGESVALAYARDVMGMKDSQVLGLTSDVKAVDMMGDHTLFEVKAGLASNSAAAQQWRTTEGQPGKQEQAWRKGATADQIKQLGQIRQQAIQDRKMGLVKSMSKEFGKTFKAVTIATIINHDTKTADVHVFSGFHSRIGWKSDQAKQGYKGTYSYAAK